MLKQKLLVVSAVLVALILGVQANAVAFGTIKRNEVKFKVRIENISSAEGLNATDGTKYPFALSPGLFVLSESNTPFFKVGKRANDGLEAQAEDGNPEVLAKTLLTKVGSFFMGIFNTPVGADKPAPIFPGGAFEFEFTSSGNKKLDFIAMYGQSNDLFFAPERAIELFDKNGNAISGDITDKFLLWDAGTEVNQAPGISSDQAPRQKAANTGATENSVVNLVKDGFTYPNTKEVLRITISQE